MIRVFQKLAGAPGRAATLSAGSVHADELAVAAGAGFVPFTEGGKLFDYGNPADLLDNPENPRLREFLQHVH